MYLNRIMGSKTKINILSALVQAPGRSFMESELAREIGSSISEVNRQATDLINCGLIRMERIGKAKMYTINKQHFLFTPLRKMFKDLNQIYREAAKRIVKYITKRYEISSVILFGSLVKEKIKSDLVREPSDIDIVIVAKKDDVMKIKSELTSFVNKEIVARYGIVAFPIVLSYQEYTKGLNNDQFIINVHARGELLYGEKPRKFS